MKILVLGASGMLGHMVANLLDYKGIAVDTMGSLPFCTFYEDLFTCSPRTLEYMVKDYDLIINCVGLLVGQSSMYPEKANYLNNVLPHMIAQYTKGKLIHISTDCVFSGLENGWYAADAVHTAKSVYGRTKSKGEGCHQYANTLVLRTSIIGPEISNHRTGLLDWVVNNDEDSIPGYVNHLWNGVTTLTLAKLIYRQINFMSEFKSGILQVGSLELINKYELVKYILKVYGINKPVTPVYCPLAIDKTLRPDIVTPGIREQIKELRIHDYGR